MQSDAIGVAHQRVIRNEAAENDASEGLFGNWWDGIDTDIKKAELCEVDIATAATLIKRYEYLGTMCNAPMFAYGIRWEGSLAGVVVFGSPSPPVVALSVAGERWANSVIQLARGVCVHWAHPHAGSKLIGYALRRVAEHGYRYAVAFADPAAGEVGTLYQATNWLYCGLTEKRPDYFTLSGKRMVGHFKTSGLLKAERRRKGRYVALLGTRSQQRQARSALLWPSLSYPKRETGFTE